MTSEKGVGDEWEFAGYVPGTSIPVYRREYEASIGPIPASESEAAFKELEADLRRKKDQEASAGLAFYNAGGCAGDSDAAIAFLDPGFVVPQSAMSFLADRAAAAGVTKEEYLNNLYRRETTSILYKHMHEEPLKGFESPE